MKIPAPPPDVSDSVLADPRFAEPPFSRAFWEEHGRGPAPEGRYRHWDTLRRLPTPGGLTAEDVWAARKLARRSAYRPIPALLDAKGDPFRYALVDPVLERLHRIDRDLAGHIGMGQPVARRDTQELYLARSLEEEAITSSQLEGASTTRRIAKEMLREGRAPRSRSERMILNTYRVMQQVRARVDEPLSVAFVCDLQRIAVEGTLEADEGPFRVEGDGIAVYDDQNQVLHRPPPASESTARLQRMCRFANEIEAGIFMHPVVKSILLHFWLAYDHPFVDGNGRTARALFYWAMLREGFWLAEYLSISRILNRARARYAKSFLYTETDDNDLTYFILAQLRVIEQAVADLKKYLERKVEELDRTRAMLVPRFMLDLNDRQRALLTHAINHPAAVYTIAWHRETQGVAYATARADLLDLAGRGLLLQQKRGRRFVFVAPEDLEARLQSQE